MRRSDHFEIHGREVHLLAVRLAASDGHYSACLASLSADESARAARFHFEQHRRAYVLGRGVLRALIGSLAGISRSDVRFSYGSKGKPALLDDTGQLRFNVSHSGEVAVYAFTRACELGVDIEQIHPVPEIEEIAARFFAPEESTELVAVPEPSRTQAFFNCWTRKEAYIKAVGDGLSLPLASFRVTLQPGEPAQFLSLGGDAAHGWTLHAFSPAPDCVGAIAYPDRVRPLRFHSLLGADQLLDSL